MDDDPFQASVRKSILEKRFSDVIRVADAAEALCLVEQPLFAGNLALVVSRHNLAGIGGPALVAELRTRIPSLPVLVFGGSSQERNEYSGEHIGFLSSPVRAEQMLALATRMLAHTERKTA